MQSRYAALNALPPAARPAALSAWLADYGHRGPLESDLAQPRFAELAGLLAEDLGRRGAQPVRDAGAQAQSGQPLPAAAPASGAPSGAWRWLFWLDRRRESFRDELMRLWASLRARILEEAALAVSRGELARAEDVFLLDPGDLAAPGDWPRRVQQRREERQRWAQLNLPHSATRDAILEVERAGPAGSTLAHPASSGGGDPESLAGIGLGGAAVEGSVVLASELVELLERERQAGRALLDRNTILVAPALEPAWAVVFGRLGGVVTELGGELSHVAILLREAGLPALLDVPGATRRLREGDRVRLDPAAGRLLRLPHRPGQG